MTYLAVDIETVPDESWSPPVDKPDAFPPIWAHRIVCVGWLALTSSYGLGGGLTWNTIMGGGDERVLLADLSRWFSNIKPTLVTYNGRRFDLPVVVMRCMRHGVQLPWHYQMRGARYRYSEEGHLDLADCLTDYGACTMMTLDDVAKSCGLPGKTSVDGSDVARLWRDSQHEAIANYCLADVAQTALLFLRFRLIQGELRHAEYEAKRDALLSAMARDPRLSDLVAGVSAIPQGPAGACDADENSASASSHSRDAVPRPRSTATFPKAAS